MTTLQWAATIYGVGTLAATLVTAWALGRSLERTRNDPEMAPLWAASPEVRGRFMVSMVLLFSLLWPVSIGPIVRQALWPDS